MTLLLRLVDLSYERETRYCCGGAEDSAPGGYAGCGGGECGEAEDLRVAGDLLPAMYKGQIPMNMMASNGQGLRYWKNRNK
ncbi:hypothetical protein [Pararcticibacter amylolyticus]|uniref:hypothetical protein n=1 Tax=Pararcticibacter amylolyticus TaxID=2173175 RepID=UPI0011B20A99|nr:hypothetical protein [Pararcticibacter amylolyticus]